MIAITDNPDASEVARTIAQFVADNHAFCDQAAWDLRRMLAHDLARRTTGQLRIGYLAPLIDLVATRGAFITEEAYDEARAEHAGEGWPSSRRLRDHYGSWAAAVRQATIFWFERAGQRKQAPRRRWTASETSTSAGRSPWPSAAATPTSARGRPSGSSTPGVTSSARPPLATSATPASRR
jgi:hypothetical protein